MPRRLYEFSCSEGHITEQLIDSEARTIECSCCSGVAQRIVSAPQVRLEGITGAFPGAYAKWERVRAEKLAQERKASS